MFIKRIIKVVFLLVLLAVVFNGPYFLTQARYLLDKPEPIEIEITEHEEIRKAEANTLWIEGLGIKAPIIYQDRAEESEFQANLQKGVVHYPQTAMPGEWGNVYLLGHSSDFITSPGDYKTVFALLPKIQIGDIINVSNSEGQLFSYKVDHTEVISPKDLSVLRQDRSKKQLILQTSYPIGTAFKRFVVVANLEENIQ